MKMEASSAVEAEPSRSMGVGYPSATSRGANEMRQLASYSNSTRSKLDSKC